MILRPLLNIPSIVLAGDTLFGLSEKGAWKWNNKGMSLISDKIIDLPDAGSYEYIAFYSPIRTQYVLHRQESGTVAVVDSGTAVDYAGALSGVSSKAQVKYIGNDKTGQHLSEGADAVNCTGG